MPEPEKNTLEADAVLPVATLAAKATKPKNNDLENFMSYLLLSLTPPTGYACHFYAVPDKNSDFLSEWRFFLWIIPRESNYFKGLNLQ
jgi:hypothetical protein